MAMPAQRVSTPLEIEFSEDHVLLEEVTIILYGQSGIGKTTIARSMPSPLFVMMRGGGEHRPMPLSGRRLPFIQLDSKEDVDKFLLDLVHDGPPKLKRPIAPPADLSSAIAVAQSTGGMLYEDYIPKTLVFDQLTSLYEIFMNHCMTKVTRNRDNQDTPALQDYGQARRLILNFFHNAYKIRGMHMVFLALEEIDEDQNTHERSGLPNIAGKLAREVMRFTDFVFRMHQRREMREDERKQKKVYEYRALLTQPEAMWQAKDSTGKLPKLIEVPSPDFDLWECVSRAIASQ